MTLNFDKKYKFIEYFYYRGNTVFMLGGRFFAGYTFLKSSNMGLFWVFSAIRQREWKTRTDQFYLIQVGS